LHQLLAITSVDFVNRRITGYTELQLRILQPDVKEIYLNCKQCKIFRVTINEDVEADFCLVDPALDICQVMHFSNLRTLISQIQKTDFQKMAQSINQSISRSFN
jgi:hypothetical protein